MLLGLLYQGACIRYAIETRATRDTPFCIVQSLTSRSFSSTVRPDTRGAISLAIPAFCP